MRFRRLTVTISIWLLLTLGVKSQETLSELIVLTPNNPDTATQTFLNSFEEQLSESNITLKTLPALSLVKRPSEIPELLKSKNEFSMAFVPAYIFLENTDDGFTYTSVMQHPGFVEDAGQNFALQDSVIGDLVATELNASGLELVSFWSRPPESLWSNIEIADMADLDGQKIAHLPPLTAAVMEKLGVSPVRLPASEIMAAMVSGVASAASGNSDQWRAFGFFEAPQNAYYVNNVSQEQGYLVAADTWWTSLSQAARNAITEAAKSANDKARSIILIEENTQQDSMQALGIHYTTTSDSGWRSFRTVSEGVWLSGSNLNARKGALDTLREVQKNILLLDDRDGALIPDTDTDPEIFFATNRNDEQSPNLSDRFGILKTNENELKCGSVKYTPNPSRKFGKIFEGPFQLKDGRLWHGEEGCSQFLQNAIGKNDGLTIYFHGYWNSFKDAVGRGIGIRSDLAISGPLLVWSWPSKGTQGGYVFDLNSVSFSHEHMNKFVAALDSANVLENVTIVAHSMGSKMAAKMLNAARTHGSQIENLVLIAPDFPPSLFKQFLAENGSMENLRTLYANEHDRALWLSEKLNGENPIGRGGQYLEVLDNIETVDVSNVARKRFDSNHAHGFDVQKVVSDVAILLKDQLPASQRNLDEREWNGKKFWSVSAN